MKLATVVWFLILVVFDCGFFWGIGESCDPLLNCIDCSDQNNCTVDTVLVTESACTVDDGDYPNAGVTIYDFHKTHPIMGDLTTYKNVYKHFGTTLLTNSCTPKYAPSTPTYISEADFVAIFNPANPDSRLFSTFVDFDPDWNGHGHVTKWDLNVNFPADYIGFGREGEPHNYHFAGKVVYGRKYGSNTARRSEATRIRSTDCLAVYVNAVLATRSCTNINGWMNIDLDEYANMAGVHVNGQWYTVEVFFLSRKDGRLFLEIEEHSDMMRINCDHTLSQYCVTCSNPITDCPYPSECNTMICDDGQCVELHDDVQACTLSGLTDCQTPVCSQGKCVAAPSANGIPCNENDNSMSLQCLKHECKSGQCVEKPHRENQPCVLQLEQGSTLTCRTPLCKNGTCTPMEVSGPCGEQTDCTTPDCENGECVPRPAHIGQHCNYDGTVQQCMKSVCSVTGECIQVPDPSQTTCTPHINASQVTQCVRGVCSAGFCTAIPSMSGQPCSYTSEIPECMKSVCDNDGRCSLTADQNMVGTLCDYSEFIPDCMEPKCSQHGTCVLVQSLDNLPCDHGQSTESDELDCSNRVCYQGICVSSARNGNRSCEYEGVVPPCMQALCVDTECKLVPLTDGTSCGINTRDSFFDCYSGRCYTGECYKSPSNEGMPCDYNGQMPQCMTPMCDGSGNCILEQIENGHVCTSETADACEMTSCFNGECVVVPNSYVVGEPCDYEGELPECMTPVCNQNGKCVLEPAEEASSCGQQSSSQSGYAECADRACHNGKCVSISTNGNMSCNYQGIIPDCMKAVCVETECKLVPIEDGTSCEDVPPGQYYSCHGGVCYSGECVRSPQNPGMPCEYPGSVPQCMSPWCDQSGNCGLHSYSDGYPCQLGDLDECKKAACYEGGCTQVDDPQLYGEPCGQNVMLQCNVFTCSQNGMCAPTPTPYGSQCDGGEVPCGTCLQWGCDGSGNCIPIPANEHAVCHPSTTCSDFYCEQGECVPLAHPGTPCHFEGTLGPCETAICTGTGACVAAPLNQGPCTPSGDPQCNSGTCVEGSCIDTPFQFGTLCGNAQGDVCSYRGCDGTGSCLWLENTTMTGKACRETDCMTYFCSSGTCSASEPKEDETECTPFGDCYGVGDGECLAGACMPLNATCSDGHACTADFCENGGCVHVDIPYCIECDTYNQEDCLSLYPIPQCGKVYCPTPDNESCMILPDLGKSCDDSNMCTASENTWCDYFYDSEVDTIVVGCVAHVDPYYEPELPPHDPQCASAICNWETGGYVLNYTNGIPCFDSYLQEMGVCNDGFCVEFCELDSDCAPDHNLPSCYAKKCDMVSGLCMVVNMHAGESCSDCPSESCLCNATGVCVSGCRFPGLQCMPDVPFEDPCNYMICSNLGQCDIVTPRPDGYLCADGYCISGQCTPNSCMHTDPTHETCGDLRGVALQPNVCQEAYCIDNECVLINKCDYTSCPPEGNEQDPGYCYEGACVTRCEPEGWTDCFMPGENQSTTNGTCETSVCILGQCENTILIPGSLCVYYETETIGWCSEDGICADTPPPPCEEEQCPPGEMWVGGECVEGCPVVGDVCNGLETPTVFGVPNECLIMVCSEDHICVPHSYAEYEKCIGCEYCRYAGYYFPLHINSTTPGNCISGVCTCCTCVPENEDGKTCFLDAYWKNITFTLDNYNSFGDNECTSVYCVDGFCRYSANDYVNGNECLIENQNVTGICYSGQCNDYSGSTCLDFTIPCHAAPDFGQNDCHMCLNNACVPVVDGVLCYMNETGSRGSCVGGICEILPLHLCDDEIECDSWCEERCKVGFCMSDHTCVCYGQLENNTECTPEIPECIPTGCGVKYETPCYQNGDYHECKMCDGTACVNVPDTYPCGNRGECISGVCIPECVASETCSCPSDCQTPVCVDEACECVDNQDNSVCQCPVCYEEGYCMNGDCVCEPLPANTPSDECNCTECQDGYCTYNIHGFGCECFNHVNTSPCSDGRCYNGQCVDCIGSYDCTCPTNGCYTPTCTDHVCSCPVKPNTTVCNTTTTICHDVGRCVSGNCVSAVLPDTTICNSTLTKCHDVGRCVSGNCARANLPDMSVYDAKCCSACTWAQCKAGVCQSCTPTGYCTPYDPTCQNSPAGCTGRTCIYNNKPNGTVCNTLPPKICKSGVCSTP